VFNLVFAALEINYTVNAIRSKEKNGDKAFFKVLEHSGGTVLFLVYTGVVFYR
jgi:hypothetical protein